MIHAFVCINKEQKYRG